MAAEASEVKVRLSLVGGQTYSVQMENAARSNKKFNQSAEDMGAAGHKGLTGTQAISGGIRVLQGDMTNNIRAVERWLSLIPGVSAAAKVMFPVVGAVAFVGVVGSMIGKVKDFIDTADKMSETVKTAFSSITDSQQEGNASLQVTVDKLQDVQDNFRGVPHNAIKDALDEARDSSEKLLKSVNDVMDKLQGAEKSNTIVGLTGSANAEIAGRASYVKQDFQKSTDAYNRGDTIAGKAWYQAGVRDSLKFSNQFKQEADATRKALNPSANVNLAFGIDPTGSGNSIRELANINALQGAGDVLGLASRNMGLQGKQEELQKHNLITTNAIKGNNEAFTNWNDASLTPRTPQQQTAWWKNAVSSTTDPGAKREAQKEYMASLKESTRANLEAAKAADVLYQKFVESAKKPSEMERFTAAYYAHLGVKAPEKEPVTPAQQIAAQNAIKQMMDNPVHSPEFVSQMSKFTEQSDRDAVEAKANYARTMIGVQSSTGQITPHQAALSNSAINEGEFQGRMKVFADQLAKINSVTDSTLTADQKELQSKQVFIEQQKVINDHQIQILEDQAKIAATSAAGGYNSAVTAFADQYSPANIAANITTNTMNSVNDALVSGMTTGKFHGADMARGIAGDLGHQALGGLESKFLPSLNKPKHVIVDNMPQGGLGGVGNSTNSGSWLGGQSKQGGVMGFISSLLGMGGSGGFDTSAAANGAGGISTAISSVADLLPMMASGGYADGSTPIIVGEKGPEIFSPGARGGYITPNHKISSIGGNGAVVNNIDARGAVDPAATRVAVQNAINHSTKTAIHGAMKSMSERSARRPSGR